MLIGISCWSQPMFLPNFPVLWKILENGTLVWICNRSEVECLQ